MRNSNFLLLLYVLPALLLSACTMTKVIPEIEEGMDGIARDPVESDAEFQRLLACVEESS